MAQRRRDYTAYLIESAWVLPSIAIPIAMVVALLLTTTLGKLQLPGGAERIDPTKVATTAPFDHPGLRQLGPNHYELDMVAQTWNWTPKDVQIPLGATVDIVATSKDVTHGLYVENTLINMMVVPGYIVRATHQFTQPGTYLFLCHEYCGLGHQTMSGQIVVEGAK